MHSGLGNDQVFGKANSLFAFWDAPFYVPQNKTRLSYRIAYGISWLNKEFHLTENYPNVAIGSHLNAFVQFTGGLQYKVNQQLGLQLKANFTHYSSGKISSPNLGLNSFTISGGMLFNPQGHKTPEREKPVLPALKRHHFGLMAATGIKTRDNYDFAQHNVYSGLMEYQYQTSHKRCFGAGVDFFYDPTIALDMAHNFLETRGRKDNYRIGMHAAMRFFQSFIHWNACRLLSNFGLRTYHQSL
ncbi:MAG: acyloxyacyl hydrolase [Bacteroidales bacterium]|nr:acyloxyacyl hydrolase [Bacteroidales bacterium]